MRSRTETLLVAAVMTAGFFVSGASAQTGQTEYTAEIRKIMEHTAYKEALKLIDADYDRIITEGIKLTEIPAPPFKEEKRAAAYAQMFKDVGLTDVEIDQEGNVLG